MCPNPCYIFGACPFWLVLGLVFSFFFLSLLSFDLTEASLLDCTTYGPENLPRKWRGRTLWVGCGSMPPSTPLYIRATHPRTLLYMPQSRKRLPSKLDPGGKISAAKLRFNGY